MVFYVRNKKIGSNYLCENTPYYLKHVLTDKHITIENKEGSDLLRKDFIRLTNDVEVGHTVTIEKVCTGYGIFDHCYRIKVSNPSQNDYDYITKNTIGRLYLYLDNIENATCWNLQTISENICTTITTKDLNSSWSTLSKHNRDWILTQMKRASEAILSDYWVFKIPKD
ncbi:hypothetical protein CN553_24455 [Bacillus cereus]|uniref:Uncharacterized protein n=1 Tax=Bacillus cereus TaxID=1396 RepID=A0A9X6U8C0_BACCE|nr:hypothetical protein [Bacillus thuringiensis]PEN87383.1 hypothetical protein CN553_24455 [Bacillus cereus]HDR3897118.1 hypothetical protein [Bacillus cereus]